MKQEIEAAAKWWADTIAGNPKQDNGDAGLSAFAIAMSSRDARPTAEQCEAFRIALVRIVTNKFESMPEGCWKPENPRWNGYARVLKHDYDPCIELAEAAEEANIKVRYCSTFPMKTVMWIDPGYVRVSCGYGAPVEVLFGTAPPEEE